MRRSGLVLLLLAAIPLLARAQAGPTLWQGVLDCDPIPNLTSLRLRQPVTVSVSNGRAELQRAVHKADSSAETGYIEQDAGSVAADGTVTLTGGAVVGRGLTYTASYTGRLPPEGGAAHFTGAQTWNGRKVLGYRRACTLDLRH